MQQGTSLKAVKQPCGFVMKLVSITLPILFSRLHNNAGKLWHAILLKDQENSCVALFAVWKSLLCVNGLLFSALVSVFADVKELRN
jgi:hypothetical protein